MVDVDRLATFSYSGRAERLAPIRLSAPGRASKFMVETIAEGSVVELGDRLLEAGADLSGQVIDAIGAGAPGDEIVAMYERVE